MKLLSRDEVFAAQDVQFEDVPTPEWGEGAGVRIRNLTAASRGVFIARSIAAKQAADKVAKLAEDAKGANVKDVVTEQYEFEVEVMLVTMTAVDENMQPIFTEADIKQLGAKSAKPVSRLAGVAQKLSGLVPDAQQAAVKSSGTTTN